MILDPDPEERLSRKDLERRFRRELILEAAERVFGRRAYHEATMQEIATESQLGMRGLYEHFPSKKRLYEAVILRRAERFLVRLDDALAREDDPLRRLEAVARLRTELFLDAPAFLPVFLAESLRFEWGTGSETMPEVQRVFREVQARLEGVMKAAVTARRLRPLPAGFLVRWFMDVLTAAFVTAKDGSREEKKQCLDLALDAFLHGALRP